MCVLPVVTLSDWWYGEQYGQRDQNQTTVQMMEDIHRFQSRDVIPLIDIRSLDAYERKRIDLTRITLETTPSSTYSFRNRCPTVVHIPFEKILNGERSFELPPRNVEFAVLATPSTSESKSLQEKHEHETQSDVNSHLCDDENDVACISSESILDFFLSDRRKTNCRSRQPWKVKYIIWESVENWNQAEIKGVPIASGKDDKNFFDSTYEDTIRENMTDDIVQDGYYYNYMAPQRLWKPDPMIENILLPHLKTLLSDHYMNRVEIDSRMPPITQFVEIWDCGCGAGRDASFLASELKMYFGSIFKTVFRNLSYSDRVQKSSWHPFPFKVVGIDNHKGSEKRCVALWKRNGVHDLTETRLIDLNKTTVIHDWIKKGSKVICLYAVRFLSRRLIDYLASSDCLLRPGSLFAISYFCKECEGAIWEFKHPKEESVLKRNELKDKFTAHGVWKVLCDSIGEDGDHGRTLIHFVAVRL